MYRTADEKRAVLDGLNFTGMYSSTEFDKLKVDAKEIRDMGFRARVVNVGSGKSVYAEESYFDFVREVRIYNSASVRMATIAREIANCEAELAKLKQEQLDAATTVRAGAPVPPKKKGHK